MASLIDDSFLIENLPSTTSTSTLPPMPRLIFVCLQQNKYLNCLDSGKWTQYIKIKTSKKDALRGEFQWPDQISWNKEVLVVLLFKVNIAHCAMLCIAQDQGGNQWSAQIGQNVIVKDVTNQVCLACMHTKHSNKQSFSQSETEIKAKCPEMFHTSWKTAWNNSQSTTTVKILQQVRYCKGWNATATTT